MMKLNFSQTECLNNFIFCLTLSEFENFHNLSKRNVKLILKILGDFEPLRGSSNKKTLYSTRSCVNWAFFETRGHLKRSFHSRFKLTHSCQNKPNLHTNSLNKLLFSTSVSQRAFSDSFTKINFIASFQVIN
jgi:hypothetical protein